MAREFYTIPMPDPNDPEARSIEGTRPLGGELDNAIADDPIPSRNALILSRLADKRQGLTEESDTTRAHREATEAAEDTASHIDTLVRTGKLNENQDPYTTYDQAKYATLLNQVKEVANNAPENPAPLSSRQPDGSSDSTAPLRPNIWRRFFRGKDRKSA